ncbi:MAG: DMT family transporter [Pseudomonadota bacterium]
MAWVYLALAGGAEIGWMVGLKLSHGLTRPWPMLGMLASMAASLVFLAQAVRTIPMGTAYAIWTGVGAAGIATLGILFFDEPGTLTRIVCIALIVAGIAGLSYTSL